MIKAIKNHTVIYLLSVTKHMISCAGDDLFLKKLHPIKDFIIAQGYLEHRNGLMIDVKVV